MNLTDLEKKYWRNNMSDNSTNNGGTTNYYDLPLPNKEVLLDTLNLLVNTDISCSDAVNLILEECPKTLNDLIEYKDMQPWQHEVFKACYALNARAVKISDGSTSSIRKGKIREINKIIYYALRGKKLLS